MSLSPDCLSRLRLSVAPFEDPPGEDFIYTDALLDHLLERAASSLSRPGGLLVLSGPSGVGRSIQLMRLLGSLPEGLDLIAFRARVNTPFDAVDFTIRAHLQARGIDSAGADLTALLADGLASGRDPVLAIDDAHLLVVDVIKRLLKPIKTLSARHRDTGQGPRLVLIGDDALGRRPLPFADPADERDVVRLQLRAFNQEQSAAYLRHRLAMAGGAASAALLNDADALALHAASGGVAAQLNRCATDWLRAQCERLHLTAGDPAPTDGPRLPLTALEAITAMAAGTRPAAAQEAVEPAPAGEPEVPELLDVAWTGRSPASETIPKAEPPPPAPPSGIPPVPAPPVIPEFEIPASPVVPPAPPRIKPFWMRHWFVPVLVGAALAVALVPLIWLLSEPPPPEEDALAMDVAPGPLLAEVAPEPEASDPPPPARIDPNLTPARIPDPAPAVDAARADRELAEQRREAIAAALAALPEIETAGAPETPPSLAATESTGHADQEPSPAVSPIADLGQRAEPDRGAPGQLGRPARPVAPAAPSDEELSGDTAPADDPDPITASAPPATSADPPAPVAAESPPRDAASAPRDTDWLARQSPRHFTIQLIAADSLATAQAHVARFNLPDVHFIPTRVRQRNFVVALVGSFPDNAAAQQRVRELPAALRDQGYWIRPIGTVQSSQR